MGSNELATTDNTTIEQCSITYLTHADHQFKVWQNSLKPL